MRYNDAPPPSPGARVRSRSRTPFLSPSPPILFAGLLGLSVWWIRCVAWLWIRWRPPSGSTPPGYYYAAEISTGDTIAAAYDLQYADGPIAMDVAPSPSHSLLLTVYLVLLKTLSRQL